MDQFSVDSHKTKLASQSLTSILKSAQGAGNQNMDQRDFWLIVKSSDFDRDCLQKHVF